MFASTSPASTSTASSASPRAVIIIRARQVLMSGGAVTACCMLIVFTQLCHESVAKGERWRAEQRELANQGVASISPANTWAAQPGRQIARMESSERATQVVLAR